MNTIELELDPWQRLIGTHPRTAIATCRQAGKTLGIAAFCAQENLGFVGVVTPTLHQSMELARRTRLMLQGRRSPIIGSNQTYVETEGTVARFFSVNERDVYGYAFKWLLFDEAGYVPDDVFYAIAPSVAVTDGGIVAVGTPEARTDVRSSAGWFERMWKSDRWLSVRVPHGAVPRLDPKFVEEERKTLSLKTFRQEYEARFSDLPLDPPEE